MWSICSLLSIADAAELYSLDEDEFEEALLADAMRRNSLGKDDKQYLSMARIHEVLGFPIKTYRRLKEHKLAGTPLRPVGGRKSTLSIECEEEVVKKITEIYPPTGKLHPTREVIVNEVLGPEKEIL